MEAHDPAARLGQLNLEIDAVWPDAVLPEERVPPPAHDAFLEEDERAAEREPFGRWLLAQRDRGDWIDNLAAAARADRDFPKNGSIVDVHARLIIIGAAGDAFEQLDDAERCWRSQ